MHAIHAGALDIDVTARNEQNAADSDNDDTNSDSGAPDDAKHVATYSDAASNLASSLASSPASSPALATRRRRAAATNDADARCAAHGPRIVCRQRHHQLEQRRSRLRQHFAALVACVRRAAASFYDVPIRMFLKAVIQFSNSFFVLFCFM